MEYDQVVLDPKHPDRKVFVGATLTPDIKSEIISFLQEHSDCFAWSHEDMVGIDPDIISHKLNVDPSFKPIKQKRRKFAPERNKVINDEVDNLLKTGKIREVKYPDWLANVVVVQKKNGKWRKAMLQECSSIGHQTAQNVEDFSVQKAMLQECSSIGHQTAQNVEDFLGDSNWDTSHFNGYTQSWEDHPNLSLNNQDHGTFTSPISSFQDWSNTFSDTFEQSWEKQVEFSESFQGDGFNNSFLPPTPSFEQVDFSENFEGDDFNNSFLPPTPSFEQVGFSESFEADDFNNSFLPPTPSFEQVGFSESFEGDDFNNSFLPPISSVDEISESLKALMNDFSQNLKRSVDNMTTSVKEIISERKIQSQTPIPCEIENFECVAMDKVEAIILESNQEMESSEKTCEHLSNPSSLQNSEEVQQNAKIVISPCFEVVLKKDVVANTATFKQQSCAKNIKIIFKRGCDNQSKDLESFIKTSSTIGEVMWKILYRWKCPLICAVKFLCRDQKAKEVNKKIYKHKWKEKHHVKSVHSQNWEHTEVLQ
ncbi:hypothetical protein OSB04_012956 [Centaurea solstitialis]|uniref:Uncharacterized protein n=1 Tax=Centaurea solstitialis TaxID=347529 RepID=A0AA38TVD6_9ASTR|nr:hypothetical protein OSB04_012956 [Centaurea solstitialis]